MSFRFFLGGSGYGKSTKLYKKVIDEAGNNPRTNYLIIVPDQFTMSVQKKVTSMHPGKCIMNIDVLSISRLGHRIFEEMGGDNIEVLDDTGKNLILSSIANRIKDELPSLGNYVERPGYIHEIKSLISEFMQYGIGENDVDKLIDVANDNKRRAMSGKLVDVKRLYAEFNKELGTKYATRETKLNLQAKKMQNSKLLQDSVVVFDGFTGFTPVQGQILEQILIKAKEVYFSFLWDASLDYKKKLEDHNLFALSSKAMAMIRRIATEAGVREEDAWILTENIKFKYNKEKKPDENTNEGKEKGKNNSIDALEYLEKYLFRTGYHSTGSGGDGIQIIRAQNPHDEVETIANQIYDLTRNGEIAYRDIAIACGNLDGYLETIRRVFNAMGIPCFIDANKKLGANPLIDYIRAAIRLEQNNFSYEAVFSFMKNSLNGWNTDRIENFCLKKGIRGKNKWLEENFGITEINEDDTEIAEAEGLRMVFIESVKPVLDLDKNMASYCKAVRELLEVNEMSEKIAGLAESFKDSDLSRTMEYKQIYDYVMYCLDQIENFTGSEVGDGRRFLQVFDAAVSEMTVGTIPQNVDRILVGDLERTRYSDVCVLFVLGANEGNIPNTTTNAGILTTNDRQILEGILEMAPGPREMMYRQRLYIYMNMTQPTNKLYISFAAFDNAGKEQNPSYLIGMLKDMYRGLTEKDGRELNRGLTINPRKAISMATNFLKKYSQEIEDKNDNERNAYIYVSKKYGKIYELINQAVFYRYINNPLGEELVQALYGTRLSGSITSFQQFFSCPYSYYLKYGLLLEDREKLEMNNMDSGNMIHKALEKMGEKFADLGIPWEDATDEEIDGLLMDVLTDLVEPKFRFKLLNSGKNRYSLVSAGRIAARSVRVLSYQLKHGKFKPVAFERKVNEIIDLGLNHDLAFNGKIDRVDKYTEDGKSYIKITDYKTGNTELKLSETYHGLSLQLPVYMDQVIRVEKELNTGDSIPAAMLIYKATDPLIVPDGENLLEDQIRKAHISSGYINSDPDVLTMLDNEITDDKSDIINLGSKRKNAYSREDLETIMSFSREKIKEAGREIFSGNIDISPYERKTGDVDACKYCPYKTICGIDWGTKGITPRLLKNNICIEDMKNGN